MTQRFKDWARRKSKVETTLEILQDEAREAGATLASNGEGGLPSEVALKVFRRDNWRCRMCKSKKNLELDHPAGHPKVTPGWEKSNKAKDLWTICTKCHDKAHETERKLSGGNT